MRQLYFETSNDGKEWTWDKQLAAIPVNQGEKSGHYQVSGSFQNKTVGTFFIRHLYRNVDKRTALYYLKFNDMGRTWTTSSLDKTDFPLTDRNSKKRL